MDKIDKIFGSGGKYQRLKKPLTAARVCEAARELADGRFAIISFKGGLLTVGVSNSSEAAELQMSSSQFIESVNEKLGDELVEKVRFKLV